MTPLFRRCSNCGELPRAVDPSRPTLECSCGALRLMLSDEREDLAYLRQLVELALQRAQACAKVARVAGAPEPRCFCVSQDGEQALLTEAEAQRFVDAINGEAELARSVLRLLARLGEAHEELESGVMPIAGND